MTKREKDAQLWYSSMYANRVNTYRDLHVCYIHACERLQSVQVIPRKQCQPRRLLLGPTSYRARSRRLLLLARPAAVFVAHLVANFRG